MIYIGQLKYYLFDTSGCRLFNSPRRDENNVHKLLSDIFQCQRREGNILYKAHPNKPILYVSSTSKPNEREIKKKGLVLCAERDLDELVRSYTENGLTDINFSVDYCDMVDSRYMKGKNADVASLFSKRLEKTGCKMISEPQIVKLAPVYYKPSHSTTDKPIPLSGVTISGRLRIIDTDAFLDGLSKGYSRHKIAGFGLMLFSAA